MSKDWSNADRGSHYQKIRLLVLERDEYNCRNKIPGVCTSKATQVHHVLGVARTGHDPDYMVATCQPCNNRIGHPTEELDPEPLQNSDW